MAHDATPTRELLLRTAEHLFARRGLDAPIREITQQAGQRNASAVYYHFGSRRGILVEIVARHLPALEAAQASALEELDTRPSVPSGEAAVRAWVEPLGALLATPPGRDFLRILDRLLSRHVRLQDRRPSRPPGEDAIGDDLLEAGRDTETIWDRAPLRRSVAHLPEPVQKERTAAITGFVVSCLADRARRQDDRVPTELDDEAFTANLVAMALGALSAPLRLDAPPAPVP